VLALTSFVGTASAQSRRLILTEEKIEGKIQKPEITIFITRQNLNSNYNLVLDESFVRKSSRASTGNPSDDPPERYLRQRGRGIYGGGTLPTYEISDVG
jgi:hypothetical protein